VYDESVCKINIKTGGAFKVERFDTELNYDILSVGSVPYSGISSSFLPGMMSDPHVETGTELQWVPDDFVFGKGFKLCPTTATTTTTPPPCPQATSRGTAPKWKVKGGPCTVDKNGCAQSPGYPGNYMDDQSCELGVTSPGKIDVISFTTEEGFDEIRIDGQPPDACHGTPPLGPYSGNLDHVKPRLQGVFVGTHSKVSWQTDSQVSAAGWKLCLQ